MLSILKSILKVLEESTYDEHFAVSPDPDKKGVEKFWKDMQDIGYIDASSINLDDHIDETLYKEALDAVIKENPGDAYYTKLLEDYAKKNV